MNKMKKDIKILTRKDVKKIYENAEDEIDNFHEHSQEKLKKKVQTYRKFIRQNLHQIF
jgi:vacuolar-type H+-ATPase subunit E/Vma4